ncbi:hypothetical protein [Pleionea sp. CnH1-48]|uniref:hypothetical protein n=1 Tax=Pleionea sp. CnH1-48 TaxID=2954494 RepID=UPI0020985D96|nr:hypothetical protein [Pleionea sp. CnH1-48]MCO7223547.1 hypothetical protein [Pleionea sp. CnH1-48]
MKSFITTLSLAIFSLSCFAQIIEHPPYTPDNSDFHQIFGDLAREYQQAYVDASHLRDLSIKKVNGQSKPDSSHAARVKKLNTGQSTIAIGELSTEDGFYDRQISVSGKLDLKPKAPLAGAAANPDTRYSNAIAPDELDESILSPTGRIDDSEFKIAYSTRQKLNEWRMTRQAEGRQLGKAKLKVTINRERCPDCRGALRQLDEREPDLDIEIHEIADDFGAQKNVWKDKWKEFKKTSCQ